MRDKEKEMLEAIVPENAEIHRKRPRRTRRRLGLASYLYSVPSVSTPSLFTIKSGS